MYASFDGRAQNRSPVSIEILTLRGLKKPMLTAPQKPNGKMPTALEWSSSLKNSAAAQETTGSWK